MLGDTKILPITSFSWQKKKKRILEGTEVIQKVIVAKVP